MFKKILLPTDGSDLSTKAIEGGLEFAKALKASVVGVTVVEPYSYSNLSEYRPETLDEYEGRMMKSAAERLGKIADAAAKASVPIETLTVKSFSPYEAIIEVAKDKGCDVIFMASHGRRGLSAVLLGSETQKVLTHSSIPVMVYR
ncbi:MAG TPA: universal stress protein [Burkholderiaceae bacterium]|nr:universal stress protein [Burkholderiaceae bacterium]HQR69391.1 universal stress protein [Burkholderiaceae bacterium]